MDNLELVNKLDILQNNIDDLIKKQKIISKISRLTPNLKFNNIINSNILNYNLFNCIWEDFVSKKFKIKTNIYYNIIDFSSKELENSNILKNIFISHLNSYNEDLIMIYKKNSDQVVYYLKSYQIINTDKISLPFHKFKMPIYEMFDYLNKHLKDNEIIISTLK